MIRLITGYGVRSAGDDIESVADKIANHLWLYHNKQVKISHIEVPYQWAIKQRRRFQREALVEILDARLENIALKHPNDTLILLLHSNATRAFKGALTKGNYRLYELSQVFLFGSIIPRGFDWSLYPSLKVHNFVGSRDKVVLFGALYRNGWSGRYGFLEPADNLTQHYMPDWGHASYASDYKTIDMVADDIMREIINAS
ncbi:MAG TPA: hypothetical protein ENH85_11170 [Candidatus Scalindua sp.]|nr:hypothetical protein [Candidatus Scalindua sp.]